MLLIELIKSLEIIGSSGTDELEVSGLFYDSRSVRKGGLFFALKGVAADGHKFIDSALANGAVALVLEDPSAAPAGVPYLQVRDARLAMAVMAARFYNMPTADIPVVGLTGTNGKTTTTYLVEGILNQAGIPSAVIGTVSYRLGKYEIPAPHTTPESADLQRIIRELVDRGAKGVVMEVSSHSLEQHRVDGCSFNVGVFTNLTRDHLDYHKDMESYLECKLRLFSELLPLDGHAVVNLDDPYAERVVKAAGCRVITYGVSLAAEVTARNIVFSVEGISAEVVTPKGSFSLKSRLMGRFNLSNILAAAATGIALDLPLDAIKSGLGNHLPVPGRLERVENDRGIAVLVDYAHTGDALENVLKTLDEIKSGRLITVFGCGGDRDRGKRPVMGEVAVRFSDLTIVTSDNPRTEEPEAIIADILKGIEPLDIKSYREENLMASFSDRGYVIVPDRRKAIKLAMRVALEGDLVLLAGKGHEDYQIIGTEKHHFDDREEAATALRGEA